MSESINDLNRLIRELQERNKELNCLYKIEDVLRKGENEKRPLEEIFIDVTACIPLGMQFPDIAKASVIYDGKHYPDNYAPSDLPVLREMIHIRERTVGSILVWYTQPIASSGKERIFLPEECRMVKNLADRLGHLIMHRMVADIQGKWHRMENQIEKIHQQGWWTIIDMLKFSDKKLYVFVCRKMLYYLCWNGIKDAKTLLKIAFTPNIDRNEENASGENIPQRKQDLEKLYSLYDTVFKIAAANLNDSLIMQQIQHWINEEKSRGLFKVLENPHSSLADIIDTISQYQLLEQDGIQVSQAGEMGVRVSLIRRLFSDQLEFIKIAKGHVPLQSYYGIVQRIIHPQESHGKLGGKSSGLFLAEQVLRTQSKTYPELTDIRTPRTWYVTSDGMVNFIYYNSLEGVMEQKYKDMDEVQLEYPNIIQIFKNAHFPPEIIRGLSLALDDIGEKPIIVRSSSLLEDRVGAAFCGKYKSLFLANCGDKKTRLEALTDAIAEVYASVFSPDPIAYRSRQGLLDFNEEMGIMIQEVVGKRFGPYFLPIFSGVAFSRNEFRWSARIKRDDGLLRMVTGLGTRAVDRTADDYPILIAPHKPELRVNVTPEETIRYAPKKVDLINLETKSFQTIPVDELLKNYGNLIPSVEKIVSQIDEQMVTRPTSWLNLDFDSNSYAVTFEGIVRDTPFIKQISLTLKILQEVLNTPVDIEFAHDGSNLYLLQCRPQSYNSELLPSPIPKNIPSECVVFKAYKNISNGYIPDLSHVVLVDPGSYYNLDRLEDLQTVGHVIGKLNTLLPKRRFLLIGPGRWGSRGDIKLGVQVTYADINNTAALIEIAQKKGNYTPELSFGTHFFQDLVESSIRYIPLYLDDERTVFNWDFFLENPNCLRDILPEYSWLENTIRLIDIAQIMPETVVRVLMNAEQDTAVAYVVSKEEMDDEPHPVVNRMVKTASKEEYWLWRKHMAERIAAYLDPQRFGVVAMYLFGSTKNATAGPKSDIDILIHFRGTQQQRLDLTIWLEGWSKALAEINHLKTGHYNEGLLDVHIITDRDIERRSSYAVKINAVTDSAVQLPLSKRK